MYRIVLAIFGLFSVGILASQPITVKQLNCENSVNPVGVEMALPHFSWQIAAGQRNAFQSAYQVLVADDPETLAAGKGNIWDSRKVQNGASIQVRFSGKPLQAARTYYWKVRIWDQKGNLSAWSEPASWQTGLFTPADWKGAKWIAYETLPAAEQIIPAFHGKGDKNLKATNNILPLLRKTFTVKANLKRATTFICGLGQFEMSLNGVKTGDHFLDPAWTKYDKEARYVTFDITKDIKTGSNAIGVMLGNGFYYQPRDRRYRKLTGAYGYPKMICRIQLEYQNGTVENFVSDASWKTAAGPVTYSSIYGGEDYNATLEQPGWNTAVFNDAVWKQVVLTDGPPVVRSQMADPLKIFENFTPVKTTRISDGVYVFDLGQNASGIPQITVQGRKGDTVRVIPAELLNEDGTANQKSTGKPVYYDYIIKGEGVETWQPRFTYYGFRYVQVEGAVPEGQDKKAELPVLKAVKGLHTRNAMATVGSFTSSSDLFNRTAKLIDWAIRSNTVSIFTDCPHRERLGWQEEVHLVGNSIRYNYNIANLCRKVIDDIQTAQTAEGLIPATVPEYTVMDFADGVFRDSPEWGSNGIILPWYLYEWYGDKDIVETSYGVMQRYLDYLTSKSKDFIVAHGLSDWYDIGPERSGFSQLTPLGLTATAYYYYDLVILQKAAKLLNKPADVAKYAALAAKVKAAFNHRFFDKEKMQYGTGSQAANAIAVYMQLVEPQYKDQVVANIVKDIRKNSLTAGDIGYRYLIQVLADEGRSDVIYEMNSNPDVPGYGYQLAKGATALTESWVASPIVSNNHFMLGHILEWFYSGLAGISPAVDAVAFNHIVIRPESVGDLTSAAASYESPYGLITSSWKKDAGTFELSVTIPGNTDAVIYLPAGKDAVITESGKLLTGRKDFSVQTTINGRVAVQAGSGTYMFVIR